MLKAAIAGVGFMGWIHYLAYQRSSHAMLTAFCSRDQKKRAGDWRDIRGNFGPPGERIDLAGIRAYETFEQILEDPEIDLVDICLPPSLHVSTVCQALEAGKHVLCEKPLGLTTKECDQIRDAAARYDRQVLVAQVLPYMGQFQYAYHANQNGDFGKPRRGYFKRVISPPTWIPDFYDPQRVGGPLIDLHVHDAHFVRLLYGMPRRVMCSAEMKDGIVKFCQTLMEFDDPGVFVGTSSGVSNQTARSFCHGFEMEFEQATMQFELSVLPDGVDVMPFKVLGNDGSVLVPELPNADDITGFTAEIDDAVASIRTGRVQPRLDVQYARDAIHICQCLQRSAETGQWIDCAP
ncbi:MAG: Gfo/Idh/MocA family oxidoreductase [Pirellulaceae bacterium]